MNVHDVFPSRFVKAHDLGDKEVIVTIKSATMEELGQGSEKERKLCLWFERATKGFVLNKTNAMIIASMYGPETENWKGKEIAIYSARVKAFGAWHDAVRVKEQIPARNVGAAQMPDAMQEAPPIDDEDELLDVEEGQISDPSAPRDGPELGLVDDIWETNPPKKPNLLSQAQLTRLNIWGHDLYKNDWDMQRSKLVEAVTKGAVRSSKELSPSDADVLIKGMEKKLAVANATVGN